MKEILIHGGTIVNEGTSRKGWVLVRGERIAAMGEGEFRDEFRGTRIDAEGMFVMPGVIDDHVHFREPGLDYKGDIYTESRAAVAGGVTSFMDMPNTKPVATTRAALEEKFEIAAVSSSVNYSFYLGATNENLEEVKRLDPRVVCGVKLFMGSSTGNMLVDDAYALSGLFAESPVIVAAHCEDELMIRENADLFRAKYGTQIAPEMHPLIRTAEACYRSSAHAVEIADKYGADLHILHVTTARELSLFDSKPLRDKKITAEACVHHLWFCDEDYATRGNLIKVNPAIKTAADRDALREGLTNGKLDIVGTDHAPHTLREKECEYWECPSGAPAIQHSLVSMLELSGSGVISVEQVVDKMCHAPAVRYAVKDRGFLRVGSYADITVAGPSEPWKVEKKDILYKCGWSPLEGTRFGHAVRYTLVNGNIAYQRGLLNEDHRGMPLAFDR